MRQLSKVDLERYARHLSLRDFGETGQHRLKNSSALIVGTGGLGSPVAQYLAAAGVGKIGVVDDDIVELSNLQRQVIFGEADVGGHKTQRAAQKIRDLNADVFVDVHTRRLSEENVAEITRGYDVLLDCTDSAEAKITLNEVSQAHNQPLVYGSIHQFTGQASVFGLDGTPCYECLFPDPDGHVLAESCAAAGVLGVLPAVIGGIQATEAIKIITDIGEPLSGRMVLYDGLKMRFEEVTFKRNTQCRVCSERQSIQELQSTRKSQASAACDILQISHEHLKDRLARGDSLQLVDVRETDETLAFKLARAINIPLHELALRTEELDPSLETVVYCQSGRRSNIAGKKLSQMGFSRVLNLESGVSEEFCESANELDH